MEDVFLKISICFEWVGWHVFWKKQPLNIFVLKAPPRNTFERIAEVPRRWKEVWKFNSLLDFFQGWKKPQRLQTR